MNLMKYRYLFFLISAIFLVPGIISLLFFGLKPGVDFAGGTLWEFKFNTDNCQFSQVKAQEIFTGSYEVDNLQPSGDCQFILRGKQLSPEQKNELVEKINLAELGEFSELRFESVGPTIGKELLQKTLVAVFLVAGMITLYVWRQFDELKYGVCAILAMFHDSLILLGSFSILGFFLQVEVDVLFVTALLTTLSFSVHDTIVVYDRIRELKRTHPRLPFIRIVNLAVLQTLARSINNSVTIIIMLLSLAILGGESIKWFATALLIGAITGTYSSTFTAAPLLLLWDELKAFKNRVQLK